MKNTLHIFFFFALFSWCNLDAQTNNIDFELTPAGTYTTANAVSGWTVSSRTATSCNSSTVWTAGSPEFSVLSTPLLSFPFIGTIPHSFLGGTKIACLNNTTANSTVTKLTHTISVTSSSTLFQLAFAGVWQEGIHACCEQAGFEAKLFNNLGSVIPCNVPILSGASCQSIIGFSATSNTKWTNWQVKYVDLTPYIGTTVTLEISSHDCVFGDHYGTLLIDAKLGGFLVGSGVTASYDPGNNNSVNFCSGSNQATIFGIPGYQSYQWYAPGTGSIAAPQGTMANLTISNPIAGSVYTLNMTIANGSCVFTNTYALSYSSVSITATGTSSTCIGGASGSASVLSSGSGTGYTYTWLNSNNALIGNSSTISNLSPGVYSIMVTAAGAQSTSCGSAMRTVTIHTSPQSLINVLKPYCGNEAYLTTLGGSNHQWYNNLTAISSTMGGTASSYTVVTPTNGDIYYLRYFSNQGCQDSIKYTLTSISSGTLNISSTTICPGANNGAALINIIPTSSAPYGMNYLFVNSVGTTPQYSASINPTSFNSYSISNLFSGGTYSVNAFDGLCKYGTSFSITPFIFDYTLTPTPSPTLCQMNNNFIVGNVNLPYPLSNSQFTYSWVPSPFIFNGYSNSPNAFLTPSATPGTISTIIYTVIVTPTLINCPLTKTVAITLADPPPPNINAIPQLCKNASQYSIATIPSGGTFINGLGSSIGTNNGIITSSLSALGTNNFTYAISVGPCVAKSSGSYTIKPTPTLSISGNTVFCSGESTTLFASGALTYTWSNTSTTSSVIVYPLTSTTYTVEGTDALGCKGTAYKNIQVNVTPTVQVAGNFSICPGLTTKLFGIGANFFAWSNGASSHTTLVTPSVTTIYTVIGTSYEGCTDSKTLTVVVSGCVGFEDLNKNNDLNIYPNPSNGNYFIEAENISSIIVTDELGKIIVEEHFKKENYQLDLSKFQNGIYTLQLFYNQQIKTIKLIKAEH